MCRVVVNNLVKRYHYQPVLNQLSFTLNDGDFCLLVGDNGAGKTTLLRILAGFVRPSAGEITIYGANPSRDPALRAKIGYVGHQSMFYQDLTAVENLQHYASLYQEREADQMIRQILDDVGLTAFKNQPVRIFSRGMQQRLTLARALLHKPSVLLFDEPYAGLDQSAAIFLDEILQKWHKPGCMILLAAHRPQRLLKCASHIAWLKGGIIHQHLPIEHLNEDQDLQHYLQEVG